MDALTLDATTKSARHNYQGTEVITLVANFLGACDHSNCSPPSSMRARRHFDGVVGRGGIEPATIAEEGNASVGMRAAVAGSGSVMIISCGKYRVIRSDQYGSASTRAPDANTTRDPATAPTSDNDGFALVQILAPVVNDSIEFK